MAASAPPRVVEILVRKDVLAGLLFIAVAASGLWLSRDYAVGTALRMGTGYVPRLLCWLLGGLGVIIAVKGLLAGPKNRLAGDFHWRPLAFAPLAILAFAVTIERFGLIIAILALVATGALAGRAMRTFEVLLTAVVLVIATIAIFVWGLGLTIAVWPEW